MNLFKKTTATIALVALVSGIFSTGVAASSSTEVEAANALAATGYINNHSDDTAAYNLNQNVLRQEIAAVARGIAGVEKKSSCDNSFADVSATTPNTWACASIEALLDADLISANTNFNPENEISKAEAVGMMVKAAFGAEYAYDSNNSASWQAQVVDFAVSKGVVASFTNYDTAATRGFVFEAGYEAMNASEEVVEENTCDEISQLLGLCGEETTMTDDTTNEETTTIEDTTTEDTIIVSGDNVVSVELSPETADATDVPAPVSGIEVMKFDVTAGSEDVSINSISLQREGLGASSAVSSVVLFADNARVSKAKTFNSTTDLAEINITPALVVMAGETKTITAKVATTAAGKFTISVENVNATSEVELGNVVSSQFEAIGGVALTTATIESDGTVTNPKLGEEQADLLKFKVTNNGNANEDIELASITFKDDSSNIDTDVENITLYYNNTSVAVVPVVDGKYVTFNFATPVVIAEDKTEKFIIKGDIVAGASDTIDLFIDNVLDITVKSPKNEYATVVVNADIAATAALLIQAGQVTIIDTDAENDTVLDNKNNVVFGTFEINATSGKDLYVDKITFNLADDKLVLDADVENVELFDATNGVSYDPDATVGANANQDFVFSDLDLSLTDGSSVEFQIRADIVNGATAGAKITATLDVANDVIIKEAADDKLVTDKIPSSISYKDVEIVSADMTINALVQSTTSKVIGTKNVEAFDFEVRANNDASDLTVKELTIKGVSIDAALPAVNTDGTVLSNTRVNALYLYDGDTLLDSKSASELNTAGEVTFDGLNIVVAKNDARTLTVKLDILDDSNNANDTIELQLVGYYVEDSESDNVYIAGDLDGVLAAGTIVSKRIITIQGVGTLALTVDTTDTEVNKAKNIGAGTTSDFVASYEFVAVNEGTKVIDLQIDETSAGLLANGVSEVVIYADDKTTEIARQIVTSDTVTFNNINYVVEEGSSNMYVKVVTHNIGKDEAGSQVADLTLTMTVTDAEGAESGKAIVLPGVSGNSLKLSIQPVRVSNVAFVSSNGGEVVNTTLVNGENTLAIIAITTDSSNSTDSFDGSELKTLLTQVKLDVLEASVTTISAMTIERINGADSSVAATLNSSLVGATALATFDLATPAITDDEIENSTTAYYVVKATVSKDNTSDTDDYVQVKFSAFTASNVEYKSNDSAGVNAAAVTDARLGVDSLDATQINE